MPVTDTRHKSRMTYDQAFVINGKTPPQAIEIEEAVLGALMLDQNAIVNAIEMLHPDFFYKPECSSRHRPPVSVRRRVGISLSASSYQHPGAI